MTDRTFPETETFLPCPFCGNTDLNTGVRFPHGSSIREPAIRCGGCGVQGPQAAWSQRVGLAPTPDHWRCFHCNEVFTDAKAAANHFGVDHVGDETLCQMAQVDGGIARIIADLSEELQRYRSEDNESYREFYRLGADHSQALIREEQKGYERGLVDGRASPDTSTDRASK